MTVIDLLSSDTEGKGREGEMPPDGRRPNDRLMTANGQREDPAVICLLTRKLAAAPPT